MLSAEEHGHISKGSGVMSDLDLDRLPGVTEEEKIALIIYLATGDSYEQTLEDVRKLMGEKEQEERFCPACDAGVGCCIGPHKGNDEILTGEDDAQPPR